MKRTRLLNSELSYEIGKLDVLVSEPYANVILKSGMVF